MRSGLPARRERDPMSRPRRARPAGSARPRSARPPTTGSRRSRPIRRVARLPADDPVRRPSRARGNCPSPYIALDDQPERWRVVGRPEAALRVQGIRPVRPDHRGRAVDRGRLRGLSQRLQRHVHQVDGPRRDLVRAGQDVRQRVLDRQAGTGHERRRQERLRVVQRADGRRSVRRAVDRLRGDLEPGQGDRFEPLLLRVRRRRGLGRHCLLRRVGHPLRRRREQGHRPDRDDRRARVRLARRGCDVAGPHRRPGAAGPRLRRGRVHARLLPRARRVVGGRERALVDLYDGATTAGGKQTISARRSTDHGTTWSAATVVSTVGEEATMPMVESRGSGDVRIAWMETSGGGNVDAWNAWYRSSTNGGATWSAPVRISDATSGAAYKTAAGFAEVYGDYGEIAITSAGKTIATWGEGTSYDGPAGSGSTASPEGVAGEPPRPAGPSRGPGAPRSGPPAAASARSRRAGRRSRARRPCRAARRPRPRPRA